MVTSRSSLPRSARACESTSGMEVLPCIYMLSPEFINCTASAGETYLIVVECFMLIHLRQMEQVIQCKCLKINC